LLGLSVLLLRRISLRRWLRLTGWLQLVIIYRARGS